MRKKDKKSLLPKIFNTTSIYLASAILTCVEGTLFAGIDEVNRIEGKRIIRINYPEKGEEELSRVLEDFNARRLQADLYEYNRNMTILKGELLGPKRSKGSNGNQYR